MRRKEKEITSREEIDAILNETTELRIGLWDGKETYIVPLNHLYHNGHLWFHTAGEGRKMDILKKDNRLSFEVDISKGVIGEGAECTTLFRSVMGTGIALPVEDLAEKSEILGLLLKRFGKSSAPLPEAMVEKTWVMKIEILSVCGKRSPLSIPPSFSRFQGTPPLETERLALRRFTPEDVDDIFAYAHREETVRYLTWSAHKTLDDTHAFLNRTLKGYENDEGGDWAAVLKETGKVVGSIGFHDDSHPGIKYGVIGYVISPEYWGRGLAPEAVRRILQFAFTEMKLKRVEAFHFPGNEKSGRVMEKAGMRKEGVLRNRYILNGEYTDSVLYAALKEEMQ